MLHVIDAIVLRAIKHGDTSVVLKVYTRQFGTRSYLVRTGKKKEKSGALLEPLNRLEMVVTESTDRDLHNAREVRLARPFTRIPFDPIRGAVALFVQEILYKVLRDGSPDDCLFSFLIEALDHIDEAEDLRHFPIQFLLVLSDHLGFRPETPLDTEDRFDLKEGHFLSGDVPHGYTMGPPLSHALARLLEVKGLSQPPFIMPLEHRRQLLDHLLLYFRLHVEGTSELRSPAVLHQVLS
jgi:DNA repair protein RecO (recombination protein O)